MANLLDSAVRFTSLSTCGGLQRASQFGQATLTACRPAHTLLRSEVKVSHNVRGSKNTAFYHRTNITAQFCLHGEVAAESGTCPRVSHSVRGERHYNPRSFGLMSGAKNGHPIRNRAGENYLHFFVV